MIPLWLKAERTNPRLNDQPGVCKGEPLSANMLHDPPQLWWNHEVDAVGVNVDLVLSRDTAFGTLQMGMHPRDKHAVGVARIVDQPDSASRIEPTPQHVGGPQLGTRDDCHLDSGEPGWLRVR